ncbi:hypothetical protein [Acinetobacter sp. NyZ410]|uniref:hypothetical protein n=1 Tax=Acinetobacter sp. NyZ410 TaxID=2929509 RepID=UPI001FB8BB7F|nr:hypothetical protein [Acinetobacter sp. NyZ410]UOH16933.1 hypothetical protein MTO68_13965 [Acinetobacter sp. NyZ410]
MNQKTNISQAHSQKLPAKTYDAGDLLDIYSLAECDMAWMNTSIEFLRRGINDLQSRVNSGELLSEHHFMSLIKHAEMYDYLSEERHRHYEQMAEQFKNEWEIAKGSKSEDKSND